MSEMETAADMKQKALANVYDVQLYIDGQFVDAESNQQFDNISPFTNEKINSVAAGSKEDIDKAAKAAKTAFKGAWGKMKQSERLSYINRIADLIDEHIEELAPLESYDTGLPISITTKMVSRASQNFRFYAEMVASRMVGGGLSGR